MKTQAELRSGSSAKRFTALKNSLSLKFLAIQSLPDFAPENLISIRSVSGVTLMELPHA